MEPRECSFIDEVKVHLAVGRSINVPLVVISDGPVEKILISPTGQGYTLLYHAANRGWCAAITWLLENGADIHTGWPDWAAPPLHVAATRAGPCLAAVLLLDAGARVDERDRSLKTALHEAARTGSQDACKLLLSRGASLDVISADFYVDPEALARRSAVARSCSQCLATADFLAEVRAAGGWDKYVHEPRADLLALRQQLPSLRERGRASPSTVRAHERLFLNTSLPDEVFSQILAFWRTSRDY